MSPRRSPPKRGGKQIFAIGGDQSDLSGFYAVGTDWLEWLKTHNYAHGTMVDRSFYLARFVAWAELRGIFRPADVTLPVLEAAHVKPYATDGPHSLENGLLLRSDMHTLFDRGLLTITPEFKLEVSSQIQEQYSNGKLYYSYHGSELRSMPENPKERPGLDFLEWHNQNVFVP